MAAEGGHSRAGNQMGGREDPGPTSHLTWTRSAGAEISYSDVCATALAALPARVSLRPQLVCFIYVSIRPAVSGSATGPRYRNSTLGRPRTRPATSHRR